MNAGVRQPIRQPIPVVRMPCVGAPKMWHWLPCLWVVGALGCNSCTNGQPTAEAPASVTAPTAATPLTAPAGPQGVATSPTAAAPSASGPPSNNTTEPAGSAVTGFATASGGCQVGGCSGSLCQDPAQAADTAFTPCIYKPEYDCFKQAVCGRETDGQCGWQETPELKKCLSRHGASL